MEIRKTRKSVLMVLLMVLSTFAAMGVPIVNASEIVLTDAVQIVNGGSANDRMIAVDADEQGKDQWHDHLSYTAAEISPARASRVCCADTVGGEHNGRVVLSDYKRRTDRSNHQSEYEKRGVVVC